MTWLSVRQNFWAYNAFIYIQDPASGIAIRQMFAWFHKLTAPKNFYRFAGIINPWIGTICLILILSGLYLGLFKAPPDYQQGESYRIIFVHVPAAWMSMFVYMVMACSAFMTLVWRYKLAGIITEASAAIGASFTFLALATGSLWGKPMWGTWWVWDARLTSELILLFLYLGYIALNSAIENKKTATRASALLVLVGVINIPIIHYSVEWWYTLHQPATVTKMDKPSIHLDMLIPLLLMALGFTFFYVFTLLLKVRTLLIMREQKSKWVQELLEHGES